MAFQPAPGIWEVDVNMLVDGQICQNTLYFDRGEGPPVEAGAQTLAEAIEVWWGDFYAPLVSSLVRLRDVEVKSLDAQNGPGALVNSSLDGDGASPLMPNNVTWVVKFVTGNTGRSQRGRNYVVGLMEGSVLNNQINEALADQFVAAYEALFAIAAGLSLDWCILSRRSNNAPRAEGVGFHINAVTYTDLTIDSQRRRLPGRGR